MRAVDLDALDAARAAATPGPWAHEHDDYGDEWWFGGTRDGGQETIAGHIVTDADHADDAALIVAAVNALPDLIAEARRYRALREAVEGLADVFERPLLSERESGQISEHSATLQQVAGHLRAALAAVDGGAA